MKRVRVVIEEVGVVDLFIVWKPQGFGWHLSVLVSTLEGGVQAVMKSVECEVVFGGESPFQEAEPGVGVVPMLVVRVAPAARGFGGGGVQSGT